MVSYIANIKGPFSAEISQKAPKNFFRPNFVPRYRFLQAHSPLGPNIIFPFTPNFPAIFALFRVPVVLELCVAG